ncbi:MAG: NADH-ubiquinone oxidoreductase-F iron-sulfur binding region domain-containing protein [Bacteroidales bacterium]|nr:NADH-ubiquinone oxidoreductase-F iron-sulfur binding region domain-containing protein [Bacteroidales bacterium]
MEAKTKVIVGLGSCGIAAGASKTFNKLKELQHEGLADFELAKTSCIGMCFKEPLVEVQDASGSVIYGDMTEDKVAEVILNHLKGITDREKAVQSDYFTGTEHEYTDGQVKIALRNCGYMDPEIIGEAEQHEAYRAIRKIFEKNMSQQDVIKEVLDSGLRGRGGGGFPTGLKWKFAFQSESAEKYIICNADEGDPGAFMDRSLLEGDPHAVLEGMMIGGYAIGAHTGVIYCRAEYPLAIKRLNIAIGQAKEKGYLGHNAMGREGFHFDIYVKEGAGAFVCGEETALIGSIEGQRGMPRKRPPFPAVSGLWKKPTNINNVETWANIPWIINKGAAAYAAYGTEKSKGTKVFALTGKIKNGGLVEVPMGITINDIIFKLGGGIQKDKKFKAVQLGGPSGGCIPAELGHTPVDYDSVTATGAIMGSGGMVVMDETTCMIDLAKFFLHFTQEESCGKCTFCRIGTKRMLEILERITDGHGKPEDIETLETLAYQIKDNSLCGLGQTAPNPVLTTLRYFRHEYEAHIFDKKCPAKVCKPLLTYTIDPEKCTGCMVCGKKCPTNAIDGARKEVHFIRTEACIRCGECYTVCRFDAVMVE